jgi:hypothetical protein
MLLNEHLVAVRASVPGFDDGGVSRRRSEAIIIVTSLVDVTGAASLDRETQMIRASPLPVVDVKDDRRSALQFDIFSKGGEMGRRRVSPGTASSLA